MRPQHRPLLPPQRARLRKRSDAQPALYARQLPPRSRRVHRSQRHSLPDRLTDRHHHVTHRLRRSVRSRRHPRRSHLRACAGQYGAWFRPQHPNRKLGGERLHRIRQRQADAIFARHRSEQHHLCDHRRRPVRDQMRWWQLVLIAAAAFTVPPGCQSNKNPSCSLVGGTPLSVLAPWPSYRADTANSGRTPNDVDLTRTTGKGSLLFDRYCSGSISQACTDNTECLTAATPGPINTGQTCLVPKHCSVTTTQPCTGDGNCPQNEFCAVPIGPISAAPIIGPPSANGEPSIYLGSTDGNVYVLNPVLGVGTIAQNMRVPGAILGSPLLGADNTLFVGGNAQLVRFETDGLQMNLAVLTGIVSASPNIWEDGTVYVATQSGLFNGVCPNGIHRFSPLLLAPSQSTAAVVQDPNVDPNTEMTSIEIVGSLGGQVRAFNIRGRTYWSFFASASVVSAVVVDEDTNIFYVANPSGGVSAGQVANGQPVPGFGFQTNAGASITASPALGRSNAAPKLSKLYVADEGRRH